MGLIMEPMKINDEEMKKQGYSEFRKSLSEVPEFYEKKGDREITYKTGKIVKTEMMSCGTASSARTLAKLGAFMANQG